MSKFNRMGEVEKRFIANVYQSIKEDKELERDIQAYIDPKKAVAYIRYGTPEQAGMTQKEYEFRKMIQGLVRAGHTDLAIEILEERKNTYKNIK